MWNWSYWELVLYAWTCQWMIKTNNDVFMHRRYQLVFDNAFKRIMSETYWQCVLYNTLSQRDIEVSILTDSTGLSQTQLQALSSLQVETLLSLTGWHCDDAIPTCPLLLYCLPNNQQRAKASPTPYTVITYSERTPRHQPPLLLFLFSPFFAVNFHRHRSQSRQSFSPRWLPHSPPVKLPGGFPVTDWQGGAAVGPACLCEMFIWSGELTGLTAHPHRAFVMWFKPPCRLSQAPLYSPIQMKAWDWLSFFGQSACHSVDKDIPSPHPTRRQAFLTGLGD